MPPSNPGNSRYGLSYLQHRAEVQILMELLPKKDTEAIKFIFKVQRPLKTCTARHKKLKDY